MTDRARLDGDRAVVTGAANGIGRAIAERLAAEGAEVVGIDVEPAPSDLSVALMEFDLAQTEALSELASDVERRAGPVSILVNAAGIYRRTPLVPGQLEGYRDVLAIDLDAPVLLATAFGSAMAGRGYGRIVNVTSIHGQFGERGGLAYDVAKAGLDQATRTLALELGACGVLCNAVAPGFVETRMSVIDGVVETRTPSFRSLYIDSGRLPLGRAAQPSEIAGLVCYLCSRDNSYTTGQVIRMDGGLTITF